MTDKTATPGKKVPDFSLPATGGKPWKLSAAAGRKLVVYFYPKDNTSGCTQEGIDFRDLHAQFRKAGADIVGVSPDSLAGFFSSRGIDIGDISTRSYSAAHTGAPMFSVYMVVHVPTRIHIAALREEFLDLCDQMNLDAILEPLKS